MLTANGSTSAMNAISSWNTSRMASEMVFFLVRRPYSYPQRCCVGSWERLRGPKRKGTNRYPTTLHPHTCPSSYRVVTDFLTLIVHRPSVCHDPSPRLARISEPVLPTRHLDWILHSPSLALDASAPAAAAPSCVASPAFSARLLSFSLRSSAVSYAPATRDRTHRLRDIHFPHRLRKQTSCHHAASLRASCAFLVARILSHPVAKLQQLVLDPFAVRAVL